MSAETVADRWLEAHLENTRAVAAHPAFPALVTAVAAAEAPQRFAAARRRWSRMLPSGRWAPCAPAWMDDPSTGRTQVARRRAERLAERIASDVPTLAAWPSRRDAAAVAYVTARGYVQARRSGLR